MKTRIAILITIVALLLAGSVALAQSSGPPAWYSVKQGPALSVVEGTVSGGHYRLTSLALRQAQGDTRQTSGVASGGGYNLLGPASPASSENGCCCLWLPCTLRSF